jgi:hypothetical protein
MVNSKITDIQMITTATKRFSLKLKVKMSKAFRKLKMGSIQVAAREIAIATYSVIGL